MTAIAVPRGSLGPLNPEQVRDFIEEGFVRLEAAFPRAVAEECLGLLRPTIEGAAEGRGGWTRPVLRHAAWDAEPFDRAINTGRLHGAFDQLVGPGRWRPRKHPGLFVIRFPHAEDPLDAGWHIDGSFDVDGEWWVNLRSKGRALLMLCLFTDVGPDDAPTRIYVGSHRDVPAALLPAGERGRHFAEVVPLIPRVHQREIAFATGKAGDVYLCHPFLVHAATWPHRGTAPRVISQPELPPATPPRLERPNGDYSPVERAIRLGLGREPPMV